ncbi:MAG: ABC transporter permease, partial [Bacteroidia bacterium]
MATAAVAISIMVMILAIAIVKGYQLQVRNKLIGFNSPIQVTHLDLNNSFESSPIEKDSVYEKLVSSQAGFLWIQSYSNKAGIIKTNEAFEGILLKGVSSNYNWEFIKEHLIAGEVLNEQENSKPEIVLSAITAKRMQVKCGETILVYFVDDPPRVRKFLIKGIFDTGLSDLDELYAYTHESIIKKLNKWPQHFISGYEVNIDNFNEIESKTLELESITNMDKSVSNIFKVYPQLFDWLQLLDMNVLIILLLMMAVAGINMITALLILILERSNMIGLLKALGARDQQIRQVFLLLAARIIFLGLIIGNSLGIGIALLQKHFGIIKLNES